LLSIIDLIGTTFAIALICFVAKSKPFSTTKEQPQTIHAFIFFAFNHLPSFSSQRSPPPQQPNSICILPKYFTSGHYSSFYESLKVPKIKLQ
jgi:hypothetical protein